MTIKEIRQLTSLSQPKFCEKYGIPLQTLRKWEQGYRSPPDYVVELLEFKVKSDTEGKSMKSKDEILKMLYVTLAELQGTSWTEGNKSLEEYLRIKLTVLYDILGEEIPEAYWEQVEEWTM